MNKHARLIVEPAAFRKRYGMSQATLAGMLGISVPQMSQLEAGKAKHRPLYSLALIGLERVLAPKKTTYHPPMKEPPNNREKIRCPECASVMHFSRQSKDASGMLIFRMMCKGAHDAGGGTEYVWVDSLGTRLQDPSRSGRRRLAPFEKRSGLARCTGCDEILQWQEEKVRGRQRFYSFRCANAKCKWFGRRVYRDAQGKPVTPDLRADLARRPGWTLTCPVCGGKLWRSGSRKNGKLPRLHCKNAIRDPGQHERDGLRWPMVFYYRPGTKQFLVYGLKRKRDGTRKLLGLAAWEAQQRALASGDQFIQGLHGELFTVQEFADKTGVHPETGRQKIHDLLLARKLRRVGPPGTRRDYYCVARK